MKKVIFTISFIVYLFQGFSQSKEVAQSLLDSANLKYQTTEYSKAIDYYLEVEENFESPALYQNIGNAYFRLNDIPRAILYYEKALKIDPGNTDVEFNLATANGYIVDRFDVSSDQSFGTFINDLIQSTSANNWATYSIISIIVLFIFLTFTIISKRVSLKRFMFYMGILTGLVSLVLIIFSIQAKSLSQTSTHAIIISPKSDIKSEPNSLSTDLFVLHEGSKVELINDSDEWYEIRIPNGTKGWIPKKDLVDI